MADSDSRESMGECALATTITIINVYFPINSFKRIFHHSYVRFNTPTTRRRLTVIRDSTGRLTSKHYFFRWFRDVLETFLCEFLVGNLFKMGRIVLNSNTNISKRLDRIYGPPPPLIIKLKESCWKGRFSVLCVQFVSFPPVQLASDRNLEFFVVGEWCFFTARLFGICTFFV